RLTGIEFQDGGRLNFTGAPVGIIHIDGSNTDGSQLRFDHNKITNLNGASMVLDTVIGVLDHNEIITTNGHVAIYPYGSRWNGGTQGDGSWAAPANYGSSQFLFIEDNTFNPSTTDAFAGARFVVRHNNILNGWVYAHGTESTGRTRGCRAIEVYNNIFTGSNTNRFLGTVRSGGVLFHDN